MAVESGTRSTCSPIACQTQSTPQYAIMQLWKRLMSRLSHYSVVMEYLGTVKRKLYSKIIRYRGEQMAQTKEKKGMNKKRGKYQ